MTDLNWLLTDEEKASNAEQDKRKARYFPLSSKQETRLMNMLTDEQTRNQYYQPLNAKDHHWMERLEKRGLVMKYKVYGGATYWRLTKQGQDAAARLLPF